MAEPLTLPASRPANGPANDDQPYCPFCGGVMVERPGRVVCVMCGTDALADVPAEVVL